MKTLSAYVKAPWQFDLREVDLGDGHRAGQVLVRVEACGICGTDLATAGRNALEWQAFGHEVAGVVVEAGPSADHLKPGDRVVLESSSFCGKCDRCHNGRVDLCNNAPNLGGLPAMGFGDQMYAPVECVVPYDGLPAEVACLAEPAGVAYDMVRIADIQLGDRVCIIGLGPIGLMALALARHRGAARLVCIGRSHDVRRLELAERWGAEVLRCDGAVNEIADLQGRFDHVLMTAPTRDIPAALGLLAYGGEMTYVGIGWEDGTISFDANDFHFRKLQLRASYASPGIYGPKVLELMRVGVIPGEELISHRFSLTDIGKAMTTCRDDQAAVVKVVVRPEGSHQ